MANGRYPDTGDAAEDRVDVRRYLGALRRDARLIATIVAVITFAVLLLSLILPKSYEASATIVLDADVGVFGPPDADSTQRKLATIEQLLSSQQVLDRAAKEVGGGETAVSIDSAVDSAVDETANLIDVSARDGSPDTAAAIANAVASSFLDVQRELEQERLQAARESLSQEIDQLENAPDTAGEIDAIKSRVNDLRVQEASAGSDLQLAEQAIPPTEPAAPRPLRNTVLAFFASIFLGILFSLGRDQLRPAINEPRELSRMFGRPVLSAIPYVSKRFSRSRQAVSAIEHEAYQSLRSAVQLAMPPQEDRAHVLLITSAVHAEGKTTVAARLGRALAQGGDRTLLISADLRWPSLHNLFGLPVKPGLTDALALVQRSGINEYVVPASVHPISVQGANHGPEPDLHVLTSGSKTADPGRVLGSSAMRSLVESATELGYSYVLLDAPPMLGIADVQGLAQLADRVLIVARLDRVTFDQVVDMQELIERLGINPLGLVVIGARVDVSPYYLSERPSLTGVGEGEAQSELSSLPPR